LALPKRVTENAEEIDGPDKPVQSGLAAYLAAPTPGTVLVFECSRYDFTNSDRPKLERVQKFYSAVPITVEFKPLMPESVRFLAQELAKHHDVKLGGPELAVLLDAVGNDANRLASEIDKLSLFLTGDRRVTMNDLRLLVPNAATSTIFTLVNALAKRDRAGALRSLDILVRDGEYLPLALTFLSTQFRLALVTKEARLSSAQQTQAFFGRLGVRMWRDRAEQVVATANAFSDTHLAKAVALIYETDRKFRDGYKDDKLVMEGLVMALTSAG
jgi:DNA polymerase-3 subunit delta